MLLAASLIIKNFVGWCIAHVRYLAVGAAILLIIAVAIWAYGCYVEYEQGKVTLGLTNANRVIDKANDNAAVLEQDKGKQEQEVNNANANAQQAVNAVNDARNSDSSRGDVNLGTVTKRFCKLYPEDSRCRK